MSALFTLNPRKYLYSRHLIKDPNNTTMFSSLLPKPKFCAHETIKVVLPKPTLQSSALVLTEATPNGPSTIPHSLNSGNTVLQIHLDNNGSIDYGKTIALSQDTTQNSNVQLTYEDTIPLKTKYPNLRHHFPRFTLETCPDDSLRKCVDETRSFIEDLLLKAAGEDTAAGPEATIVNFTPSSINDDTGSDSRGRTLEIRNYKEDPMLPPKFKLRKNREKQPSPPPPILKSAPTQKITKDVKDKWHIPSAVLNWKNNQGFAISLDKRVNAASGGGAEAGPSINIEKFGQLSLALEGADREAREDVTARNEQRKRAALEEQERKERQLKELLERSRQSGGRRRGDYDDDDYSRKRHRA